MCAALTLGSLRADRSDRKATFDQGDNGLWMRRHWLHEGPAPEEIASLVAGLRARGIRRIYPFLGPMDEEGWPGWRSKHGLVRYVPERAGAFLAEFKRLAPEIRVIPWTGGNLGRDVHLDDEKQRQAFAAHMKRLVELGADGVQLNIEPLPSFAPGYIELLRTVRSAIGSRVLSIAAYPPPTPLQPVGEVHWELPFMREVCRNVSELAVMAYDTGVTSAEAYEALLAGWTQDLAKTLPAPKEGGCEWLMGISAYDDDMDYHRPDVETIEHSLKGVMRGLNQIAMPPGFRGVAIYASFTTDDMKWGIYDRLWRGREPVSTPPLDPGNTTE